MVYDYYEEQILSILRQEPTKTYKIVKIRIAIVGSDFTQEGMKMDPIMRQREYNMIDDAMQRLMRKGEVYMEDDGADNPVYGIKRSWIERASLRIGLPNARRRIHSFRVSTGRRIDKIPPNRLRICGIVVAIIGITLALLI